MKPRDTKCKPFFFGDSKFQIGKLGFDNIKIKSVRQTKNANEGWSQDGEEYHIFVAMQKIVVFILFLKFYPYKNQSEITLPTREQ